MPNVIDLIEAETRRKDGPDIRPGDTVKVHAKVVEGNRERIQVFEGMVISCKGAGIKQNFTVRRISHGVGVERTFLVHSPRIEKVDILRHGRVRRAKLYYLRGKVGRGARVREKREAVATVPGEPEPTAAPEATEN